MADADEFLTHFAALSSADGSYVKLYLQKYTGEILEGTWLKRTERWRFRQILDAGVALIGTPLTATMYPDDNIRLFFIDDDRVVQELNIVNGETSIGSFCTVSAKLHEGCHLACAPQNWSNERFRVYHASSEGRFKSYGFKDTAWDTPGTIAVEVDPNSPLCSMNCYPWDWASPYIRTFYRNRGGELKTLGWDDKAGGWHTEPTPFEYLNEGAKFAAAYTEAKGSGKGNVSNPQKIMLFVVEDGQLQVCGKNGDGKWSPPLAVSIEREGTNIAAVSARDGDGASDIHVFTSEEDGQFVHRTLNDGDWEDMIFDPTQLIDASVGHSEVQAPMVLAGVEARLGTVVDDAASTSGDDEDELPEMGSISFMHSLKVAGLTVGHIAEEEDGAVGDDDGTGIRKPISRIQIPQDEDHEHIFVPELKTAPAADTLQRLSFFYRAAIDHSVQMHQSTWIDKELPMFLPLSEMKKQYIWSNPRKDNYPPHLQLGLLDLRKTVGIFNAGYLVPIIQLFLKSMPWVLDFKDFSGPYSVPWKTSPLTRGKDTLKDITMSTQALHKGGKGMYTKNTIGDNPQWYTDQNFAQQHLSGTNPTTIRAASPYWVGSFIKAAKTQGIREFEKHAMSALAKKSLFVQDNSYFRKSMGLAHNAELKCTVSQDFIDKIPFVDLKGVHASIPGQFFHERYACASVTLFELHDDGHLHPLAIVIDYKENDIELRNRRYEKTTISAMTNSVVIFNKKATPSSRHDEEHDWPWRYAKMCAQLSDWHRHEIGIHLVNTHLIEEGAIVAVMRTISENHPVFRLLKPHWARTLPLNHAARLILMPLIIKPIAGIRPKDINAFTFDAYKNFYWEDLYIPNDLTNRGFPNDTRGLGNNKYRNYPYAKNMVLMWDGIHQFVSGVLTDHYNRKNPKDHDAAVRGDTEVQNWVKEMHSDHGAQQQHFPNIQSLKSLIDAVTMCIHIASPQHTAVNYMQEYYQTFVPNKPPSFFRAIPQTVAKLNEVSERFIIDSLPFVPPASAESLEGIGNVWLLAAHLPHLLSDEVHAPLTMKRYALETINMEKVSGNKVTVTHAENFKKYVDIIEKQFKKNSMAMTVNPTNSKNPEDGYYVMDPNKMAISILI